jgi:hypothetical protein
MAHNRDLAAIIIEADQGKPIADAATIENI